MAQVDRCTRVLTLFLCAFSANSISHTVQNWVKLRGSSCIVRGATEEMPPSSQPPTSPPTHPPIDNFPLFRVLEHQNTVPTVRSRSIPKRPLLTTKPFKSREVIARVAPLSSSWGKHSMKHQSEATLILSLQHILDAVKLLGRAHSKLCQRLRGMNEVKEKHNGKRNPILTEITKTSDGMFSCSGFTSYASVLEDTVDAYPNPSLRLCLRNDFISTLLDLVEKEISKFNGFQHLHVLVITNGWDGELSADHLPAFPSPVASKEVTCLAINLSDSRSSPKLNALKSHFGDFHVIENASTVSDAVLAGSMLAAQRCEVHSPGFIACGHLIAPVALAPSPCIRKWTQLKTVPEQGLQLFVEIFGFLQVNDLSHPPIASRHTLIYAPEGDISTDSCGVEVLRIMMAALGASETVGMANIYIQPCTKKPKVTRISEESVELPGGREFLTHGFVSRFSARRDCVLLLSLFDEGSEAVAWLGQFDYLAPVADFEGKTVYNVAEHVTPFPVCVAEQLSYVVPSTSIPGGSDFHYVNWANTASGPSADFSKVLRLAKRLPEKADVFLKELSRLVSVGQALGLLRLLDTLQLLLMEYLPPTLDTELLLKVHRLLRIETPTRTT
ncbi:Integrator complex subunit 14 [Taenia crassiceps]|uniref:Integrator complex subunit 14 n=1 Tax=Taenia crassiceps TaxID=6207 RepID=A0ABR4Q399_9CEST